VNGMTAFKTPLINFENAKSIEWFPMGSNVRAKINW